MNITISLTRLKNIAFSVFVVFLFLSIAYALPHHLGYVWYERVNQIVIISGIVLAVLHFYQRSKRGAATNTATHSAATVSPNPQPDDPTAPVPGPVKAMSMTMQLTDDENADLMQLTFNRLIKRSKKAAHPPQKQD